MKVVISNSGEVSKSFLDRVRLVEGDITCQEVDAIAMVIPQNLSFEGRLNTSIAKACGWDLDSFILDHIYKPRVGEVYALPGFDLPAKHILLAVMPHFLTEFDMHESYLAGAVRSQMELARCMLLSSIAFPALASGRKRGFPKVKAARLVSQGVSERLHENLEDVRIVCHDSQRLEVFRNKLGILGWGRNVDSVPVF